MQQQQLKSKVYTAPAL